MKKFDIEVEAVEWVTEYVDDPCVDNERFAFLDDEEAMRAYEIRKDSGCCGDFDALVLVGGREATVGCNYGH